MWAPRSHAEPVPAEVQTNLPGAVLVGGTRLRVWGFAVYDSRLWAAPGFQTVDYGRQPFALELRYLRDFSRADIAERSLQEMQRSGAIPQAMAQRWQDALRAVLPDVKAGDRITGFYQPTGAIAAARFFFNGQPAGEIRDADFAARFFGIWLSPQTSEPAMRQALIGAAP
ncbi:MAG: hypothetical protein JWP29_915 [Rhodoferax sp.]|nr:hypothetical protein [Rhodoferax sp.]